MTCDEYRELRKKSPLDATNAEIAALRQHICDCEACGRELLRQLWQAKLQTRTPEQQEFDRQADAWAAARIREIKDDAEAEGRPHVDEPSPRHDRGRDGHERGDRT